MDSAVVTRRADPDPADSISAARLHLETFNDGHESVSVEAHVLAFQRQPRSTCAEVSTRLT